MPLDGINYCFSYLNASDPVWSVENFPPYGYGVVSLQYNKLLGFMHNNSSFDVNTLPFNNNINLTATTPFNARQPFYNWPAPVWFFGRIINRLLPPSSENMDYSDKRYITFGFYRPGSNFKNDGSEPGSIVNCTSYAIDGVAYVYLIEQYSDSASYAQRLIRLSDRKIIDVTKNPPTENNLASGSYPIYYFADASGQNITIGNYNSTNENITPRSWTYDGTTINCPIPCDGKRFFLATKRRSDGWRLATALIILDTEKKKLLSYRGSIEDWVLDSGPFMVIT